MIVVKIALAWLVLDAIVCTGWSLIRRNDRSRQREASELADRAIEWGELVSHYGDASK